MHVRYREFFSKTRAGSVLGVIAMLVFAGAILAFRNLEPLTKYFTFAEDGVWLGYAMSKGWWYAIVDAKTDYFVWGNLLFVYLATLVSDIFCGDKLICYPQALSFWSYFFYSSVSVLCYYVTKDLLPQAIRWIVFLATLMIPLGDSSGEIFGRIANIGYYLVFVTALLIFVKSRKTAATPFTDMILLVCAATNPVCLVLTLVLSTFTLLEQDSKKWIKKNGAIIIGCLVIGALIFFRINASPDKGMTGSFRLESLIEVSLARAFIYPFVFPFYNQLSDTIVVILSLALLTLLGTLLTKEKSKEVKTLISMCAIAYFIYLLLTVYMRKSLTENLGGYTGTFPDRYFMGLNIIVIFSFLVLAGSALRASGAARIVGAATMASFTVLYIANVAWLIEGETTRMQFGGNLTFQDQLCSTTLQPADAEGNVSVVIYPTDRYATLPKNEVSAAINKIECAPEDISFYVTDSNWIKGIAIKWPGFYLHNTPENLAAFKIGNTVQFSDKTTRKIVDISTSNETINVFVDGDILIAKKVGLPFKFIVIDQL
ncbi:hypothetical protein HBO37_24910 [Pseudomonas proteolytica]|uniref:hypothetical protein n=1 Tax=Pseudomonas proteolytica TaxID=219574 RepID=UPI001474C071|nr:hypothetical protein [Pseudomonas proteolytica]NMZ08599.1 hypothetical protein [Pseudomonas proteolytica]